MIKATKTTGFTLIELIAVIVLIGALAIVAIPRFLDISRSARIEVLRGIEGTMNSTINLVKLKATAQGITAAASSPSTQTGFLIDFGGVSAEIDWRNLCPESRAELGDRLEMIDFINLQGAGGLTSNTGNQYTLVGYNVLELSALSPPTDEGCYVLYDSFGEADSSGVIDCTVTLITEDC